MSAIAYILQEGTGEQARFMPCVYIWTNNKPIAKTMLSPVCKFEERDYYFEEIDEGGYGFEIPYSMFNSVDTIKNWSLVIKAQSKVESETEQPEYDVLDVPLRKSDALGDFIASELEYKDNQVTATWNKVPNVNNYVLMYRRGSNNMWMPANQGEFRYSEKDGQLTGSASIWIPKDERYQIAIAAVSGALWKIGSWKSVTGTY